jgi:hypothetical protein
MEPHMLALRTNSGVKTDMPMDDPRDNRTAPQAQSSMVSQSLDRAEEDKEEGMDRMENDGGGVVPENTPESTLVQRNELVGEVPPDEPLER